MHNLKSRMLGLMIFLGLGLLLLPKANVANAQGPTIIKLTQTGCQFIEPEGSDHGYETKKATDCKRINRGSAKDRLSKTEPLRLKSGKYIFRVENKNVPYSLGFWVRGKGVGRVTLPSISGGGLEPGTSKDYEIELVPGEYLYSCPLNPTPDYPLIVE